MKPVACRPRWVSREKPNQILVSRLKKEWDPFEKLGLHSSFDLDFYEPVPWFKFEQDRLDEYHYGRIRHFRDLFLSGSDVDPIEVDNAFPFRGSMHAQIVVLDGNHRLCGAILACVKKIPASYGGRLDLLSYLEGRRKSYPYT